MSQDVLLSAQDIVAGYVPEVNILNGCSLELYPAELVGIIGPNGAGKSTLLKAMFGLIPVTSGSVTLRIPDDAGADPHGIGHEPHWPLQRQPAAAVDLADRCSLPEQFHPPRVQCLL